MASAIYISENVYQADLNFDHYILPSSGSARLMGCILKNTRRLRNPSSALVRLVRRSIRRVQCCY